MSDVAAYHVFVCALFPVQGGMWSTGAGCLAVTGERWRRLRVVQDNGMAQQVSCRSLVAETRFRSHASL